MTKLTMAVVLAAAKQKIQGFEETDAGRLAAEPYVIEETRER